MCEYMFYKENNNRQTIFCSQTNELCAYQRFCSVQNRIIPSEGWKQCKMVNKKNIPSGAKFIKLKLKGYLYIENDDQTIKVWNTLGEFEQNYVYIKEGIIPNDYDLSLTPFEDKKYSRRKSSIEND